MCVFVTLNRVRLCLFFGGGRQCDTLWVKCPIIVSVSWTYHDLIHVGPPMGEAINTSGEEGLLQKRPKHNQNERLQRAWHLQKHFGERQSFNVVSRNQKPPKKFLWCDLSLNDTDMCQPVWLGVKQSYGFTPAERWTLADCFGPALRTIFFPRVVVDTNEQSLNVHIASDSHALSLTFPLSLLFLSPMWVSRSISRRGRRRRPHNTMQVPEPCPICLLPRCASDSIYKKNVCTWLYILDRHFRFKTPDEGKLLFGLKLRR